MTHYSLEPRTRKYAKGYGFLSLEEIYRSNIEDNYWMMLQNIIKI